MNYKKEFIQLIEESHGYKHPSECLRDFTEMAKIAIAQPFYKSEQLEERFLFLSKRYKSTSNFPKMLALVVQALDTNPEQDFLGSIYMESGLGNKRIGQFFTPYELASLNARVLFDKAGIDSAIADKGFVSIHEPACGTGTHLIAWREVMVDAGYGSFDCLVHATDLDRFCYEATYVQLSLLGVCGLIMHGNTLTGEVFEGLYTPTTFMSPKFSTMLTRGIS
jgi:type I restriction-modification system DNA methylase subunit